MIITYQGIESIKLSHGQQTIAINPVSKDSEHKSARFGADIVLITTNHPDFNGADQMSYGEKEPFVISGPGEYEVNGMFIHGYGSKSEHGGKERTNTIYMFELDNINVCFLGALSSTDLSVEAKEAMDDIDILFTPIGGDGVLNALEAHQFAVKREPHVIIPMHYGDIGEKDALKVFLKDSGAEGVKPVDKYTIKKKDITPLAGEIVVLSS